MKSSPRVRTSDNRGRRLLTGGPDVRDSEARSNDTSHGWKPSVMLFGGLITNMTQAPFPLTIGTQSRSAKFLTMKTLVRKNQKNDGWTGCRCLDRAVLVQRGWGGGGGATAVGG